MSERKAKLTLKVGEKEVHYEADVDRVEAELHRLAAELLRSDGHGHRDEPTVLSLTAPRTLPGANAPTRPAEKAVPASTAAAELLRHVTLERREIARLYADGDSEGITLRVLPSTRRDSRADALLLVLYGMLSLRGRSPVTAMTLLDRARASGLKIERASRTLRRKSSFVVKSGSRRSMAFRLTRDGIEHCEQLIPRLLPLL